MGFIVAMKTKEGNANWGAPKIYLLGIFQYYQVPESIYKQNKKISDIYFSFMLKLKNLN